MPKATAMRPTDVASMASRYLRAPRLLLGINNARSAMVHLHMLSECCGATTGHRKSVWEHITKKAVVITKLNWPH